jgi:hypothetical protein
VDAPRRPVDVSPAIASALATWGLTSGAGDYDILQSIY